MENVTNPEVFTLSGLNEKKEYKYILFIPTLLCYLMILLVNLAIIVVVVWDRNLHEPMYLFLCNLCFSGLYGTTGFYPKFLHDLLSDLHVISRVACHLQVFIIYSYVKSDYSILAVMAYDRYVAICRPLEYHSIMTKKTITWLIVYCWIVPIVFESLILYLSLRQVLCGSHIEKMYCENWAIVKLSCFSVTTNNIFGYCVIVIYFGHMIYIVCTYFKLIKTCVNSKENRSKFMQTCLPHLAALMNVTIALLFDLMYSRYGSKDISQDLKNTLAIEFLVIPPLLNPLIYGLKLTKVRSRVFWWCIKYK
ncbi:olfactory receptor 1D2-like [Chanos chanos]|uniref:Olfactory receptor 1D2-like n=1 Tax=Chanos chanos TaxID=29144 RepID=A0A6J2VLD4_CHACN|nr:olfactory receptor 1D2-like [Chanos chanos]